MTIDTEALEEAEASRREYFARVDEINAQVPGLRAGKAEELVAEHPDATIAELVTLAGGVADA